MNSNKMVSQAAPRFVYSGYGSGVVVTITRRGVKVDVTLKKIRGEWFPLSILDHDGNEHYLSDAEMGRVVREAERKTKREGSKTKSARSLVSKELDTLWMVTDPTEDSEIIDILVGVSDWGTLRNIMVGSPDWRKQRVSFHDDLRSARSDAMQRLSRIHRGDIPPWVLVSDKEGDFRMASRVASRYQKQSGDLSLADALHELQVAAEALENAHIILTSRHMGSSLEDDFSQARETADFLEKMSVPLERHIKALRRI